MKNVLIVINAVFAVAIIILFVLVLGKGTPKKEVSRIICNDSTFQNVSLPVAYVNIDSFLLNYTFAQEAYDILAKKSEDARLTLNTKLRQLQEEAVEFQRKLENNAFLSRERAEREQTRLMEKQQDLQELDTKMTQDFMAEQQKVNEQLRDTINNFLKEYNETKGYEIIFGNSGEEIILLANPVYNITTEVVDMLNARYTKK
ncbi:OmpH family outer membrane protein [Paludibacteraceae bacterium OttesenSCG-928-F17]|nr:OmpH family outer membrane protein [Paludibacteraceae bacterium OttesenSCG-928-F17]